MIFDEVISRKGTHSEKWDEIEKLYGVPVDEGIPMWVADMDFRPPDCVQRALHRMSSHGIYGYYGDDFKYRESICWWMENRHGWRLDPSSIFTTHGLVNGTALCIDTFTKPGDGIILFTPVYHSFFRILNASNRKIVECPLIIKKGQYTMDFELYSKMMSGNEKMIILCSPHNPGGRVWKKNELQRVADFAKNHNLILVSDEIHHDLVYSGNNHIAMPLVDEQISNRLVMLTATTKTFNIAGAHTGNVIIEDHNLNSIFKKRMTALGLSPNSFGLFMSEAAYSPEGAQWVDDLNNYLNENRKFFDRNINKIPGVKSMHLEGTYLAWVNFTDTGLTKIEVQEKIQKKAKIAANHGETFGCGGEGFFRFNFAMPKVILERAIERLINAFIK